MANNNNYKIQLKNNIFPPEDSFDNIKGISSLKYNKKDNIISVIVDEKFEDDAAEILQDIVSGIRSSGGEVVTGKITQPVLNMTCAACASSTQNILLLK